MEFLLAHLVVRWTNAEPAIFEAAMLRQLDWRLQGKGLNEVIALLKSEPHWTLGPYATDQDADSVRVKLLAGGLRVEKVQQ